MQEIYKNPIGYYKICNSKDQAFNFMKPYEKIMAIKIDFQKPTG
jgi:hypothetical protein